MFLDMVEVEDEEAEGKEIEERGRNRSYRKVRNEAGTAGEAPVEDRRD